MNFLKEKFTETYKILLEFYPQNEALSLTYFVFENLLNLNKVQLALNFDKKLNNSLCEKLNLIVEKLKKNYPVQYIFNKAYCYGFEFFVDENVLIPRPETELLIEAVLTDKDFSKAKKIIDIGTGSGCIAIILKMNTQAEVWAIDKFDNVLNIAKNNAKKHNTDLIFKKIDILKNPQLGEKFDIIVSNPPYIPENQKHIIGKNVFYEPEEALFVPKKKPVLFYEKILQFAETHLIKKGKIFLELNDFLALKIEKIFAEANYKTLILNDLNNKKRILKAEKNG